MTFGRPGIPQQLRGPAEGARAAGRAGAGQATAGPRTREARRAIRCRGALVIQLLSYSLSLTQFALS